MCFWCCYRIRIVVLLPQYKFAFGVCPCEASILGFWALKNWSFTSVMKVCIEDYWMNKDCHSETPILSVFGGVI